MDKLKKGATKQEKLRRRRSVEKRWREDHKMEAAAANKKWREENKEYLKIYRESRIEITREINAAYHKKHYVPVGQRNHT